MRDQQEEYPYLFFTRFHETMQQLTPEQKESLEVFADEGIVRVIHDGDLIYQKELPEAFCDLFKQLYGVQVDPHTIR